MFFLGPLLIFLLFVAPGMRLLLLASRTRQPPEFWCGLYFVGAAVGLSLRVLGSSYSLENPTLADSINTIGHLSFAAGTIAMCVFTLQVFHPSNPGARAFAGLTIVAIISTSMHTLLGGFASIENSHSMVATNFTRLIPTSWAFYESIRYWKSMNRREALGLADPILTNRFMLWSIWTAAVTFVPMFVLGLRTFGILTLGDDLAETNLKLSILPSLLVMIRITFLLVAPIAAISLSLSFFPPASYLARVRARAERRARDERSGPGLAIS